MFHIVLYQPEIPPNTGNIIRLCANTGCRLHLIEPLGFSMDAKALRRAGLDYHEFASVQQWPDYDQFVATVAPERIFALSTKGRSLPAAVTFAAGDCFLFGPESRGLPADIRASLPVDRVLRLPMMPGRRSLNLANAAAIMVYEAWRQLDFEGAGQAD